MRTTSDIKYKNKSDKYSSHSLIISQIKKLGPKNTEMLDIGCFTGELLNRIRQIEDTSNIYYGADLANYINKDFDFIKFYTLDFNSPDLDKVFENRKFEIIILGDILEHLVDPWKALDNLVQIVKHTSKILISIPNSAHWYFRLKVLLGKIEYTRNGLFDKTHLRFFTKKSSKELIENSKFKVISLNYSSIPWENILNLRMLMKPISILERFLIALRPEIFAYQFIYLVEPKNFLNAHDLNENNQL
jgi:2-polyprenyl-3-methyl-5-hydroxy-6-metoxy-1,4-benzoquinol methylase